MTKKKKFSRLYYEYMDEIHNLYGMEKREVFERAMRIFRDAESDRNHGLTVEEFRKIKKELHYDLQRKGVRGLEDII